MIEWITVSKEIPTFEEIRSQVTESLMGYADFVYLVGSAATKRFQKESDIDLAVYFKKEPKHKDYLKLVSELEESFQREVQLAVLNKIDPIFGQQVLENGRLCFESDPKKHLEWKVKQMSIYPDFKRSRKVIEDQLLNRKKYV